jgi:hypothetical protein
MIPVNSGIFETTTYYEITEKIIGRRSFVYCKPIINDYVE